VIESSVECVVRRVDEQEGRYIDFSFLKIVPV
jgi:hypothetical protein